MHAQGLVHAESHFPGVDDLHRRHRCCWRSGCSRSCSMIFDIGPVSTSRQTRIEARPQQTSRLARKQRMEMERLETHLATSPTSWRWPSSRCAVLFIALGALGALLTISRVVACQGHQGPATTERRAIWLAFARWLVAGLTFQLAADIVNTSFSPTWEDLGTPGGDRRDHGPSSTTSWNGKWRKQSSCKKTS